MVSSTSLPAGAHPAVLCAWCGLSSAREDVCEQCGSPITGGHLLGDIKARRKAPKIVTVRRSGPATGATGDVTCTWCGQPSKAGSVCVSCGSPLSGGNLLATADPPGESQPVRFQPRRSTLRPESQVESRRPPTSRVKPPPVVTAEETPKPGAAARAKVEPIQPPAAPRAKAPPVAPRPKATPKASARVPKSTVPPKPPAPKATIPRKAPAKRLTERRHLQRRDRAVKSPPQMPPPASTRLIPCSRCGEPSEESLCESCREAFSLLRELSSLGD
jgi:hypothetical protein